MTFRSSLGLAEALRVGDEIGVPVESPPHSEKFFESLAETALDEEDSTLDVERGIVPSVLREIWGSPSLIFGPRPAPRLDAALSRLTIPVLRC